MGTPTTKGGWENDSVSRKPVVLNLIKTLLMRKKGGVYTGKQLHVSVTKPYEGPELLLDHEQLYIK